MTYNDPNYGNWRAERAKAGGYWTVGLMALVVAIIAGALFFLPGDGTRTAQNDSPVANSQTAPVTPTPVPTAPRPNG